MFKENGWINLDNCDLDLCLDADDLNDYLFENGFNGFYEDCEPPLDEEEWYEDEDDEEDWYDFYEDEDFESEEY